MRPTIDMDTTIVAGAAGASRRQREAFYMDNSRKLYGLNSMIRKWEPVFRKDHASENNMIGMSSPRWMNCPRAPKILTIEESPIPVLEHQGRWGGVLRRLNAAE